MKKGGEEREKKWSQVLSCMLLKTYNINNWNIDGLFYKKQIEEHI